METDKPLISILMAVYEPRLDWLEEQLKSLENQTYPNLRLYVRDDCSPTVSFSEIQELVKKCVHSFPYEITRNEKNLGSNGTFQRLTQKAEGEYFAYCDQDDVWLPEKLEVLQKELENSGALLACSDMYIIDGEGKQTADSITKVRRHHSFHSGTGLAEGLFVFNFVTGCTMLVKSKYAKAAVPFCPYMVHDHYIALCCAAAGSILSVPRSLIRYRIHGGNQTGIMAGVSDKKSYGELRINEPLEKFRWLQAYFPYREELQDPIDRRLHWMEARQRNWAGKGGKYEVWKGRAFSRLASLFEVTLRWIPEWAFRWIISLSRRNII